MVPVYWLVISGIFLLLTGIAIGTLLLSPRSGGEHANYDPAFSVYALTTRLTRESHSATRAPNR